MTEKSQMILDKVKKALAESSAGSGMPQEVLFIPEKQKIQVRFLSDFEDAVILLFHEKFDEKTKYALRQPCWRQYGKDCPFHVPGYKDSDRYIWTVFVYEQKVKRMLLVKPTKNSVMNNLVQIYEQFGSLTDRDIIISRNGTGLNTTYTALALDKAPYEGELKKPWTAEKILEYLSVALKAPEAEAGKTDDEPVTTKLPATSKKKQEEEE